MADALYSKGTIPLCASRKLSKPSSGQVKTVMFSRHFGSALCSLHCSYDWKMELVFGTRNHMQTQFHI
jgi:hypothetical protein